MTAKQIFGVAWVSNALKAAALSCAGQPVTQPTEALQRNEREAWAVWERAAVDLEEDVTSEAMDAARSAYRDWALAASRLTQAERWKAGDASEAGGGA